MQSFQDETMVPGIPARYAKNSASFSPVGPSRQVSPIYNEPASLYDIELSPSVLRLVESIFRQNPDLLKIKRPSNKSRATPLNLSQQSVSKESNTIMHADSQPFLASLKHSIIRDHATGALIALLGKKDELPCPMHRSSTCDSPKPTGLLGVGAYGRVKLGIVISAPDGSSGIAALLGKKVAVKIVTKSFSISVPPNAELLADDERSIFQLLTREVLNTRNDQDNSLKEEIAHLVKHDMLVAGPMFSTSKGKPSHNGTKSTRRVKGYFAMKYVEGETLLDALFKSRMVRNRNGGTEKQICGFKVLPPSAFRNILTQSLRCLKKVWLKGDVHGDSGIRNFMVRYGSADNDASQTVEAEKHILKGIENAKVSVIDFGRSREYHSSTGCANNGYSTEHDALCLLTDLYDYARPVYGVSHSITRAIEAQLEQLVEVVEQRRKLWLSGFAMHGHGSMPHDVPEFLLTMLKNTTRRLSGIGYKDSAPLYTPF